MSLKGLGAVASGVVSGSAKNAMTFALNNKAVTYGALGFVGDVNREVAQGQSVSTSVFKSGARALAYANNPLMMTVLGAAPVAVQGVQAARQFRRAKGEQFVSIQNQSQAVGSGYMDTSQAQTMRQAALQQIQGNKLNARSALGGEARIFSNRRYTG